MLRITKLADYGFVLLIEMAGRPRTAMYNARDLAQETNLPLPMVSKILKALARGGILTSHRGVRGGYSLLRGPEAVSAAEIIGALDGPIRVSECLSAPPAQCGYEILCPVKTSWRRLNDAISDALTRITLAEMARIGPCRHGESNGAQPPSALPALASWAVAASAAASDDHATQSRK